MYWLIEVEKFIDEICTYLYDRIGKIKNIGPATSYQVLIPHTLCSTPWVKAEWRKEAKGSKSEAGDVQLQMECSISSNLIVIENREKGML